MSVRFAQIDLSRLPAPEVIEPLDFEALFEAMKAEVAALDPDLASVLELESEPAVKVLQAIAYARLLDRARVNDAARAVMLATARGADLDHLGVLFGVERAEITPADLDASPPVAAVMESDERFRARIQLSLQAFSTGGPAGAYRYWAFTAHPAVLDAMVDSPEPGDVRVVVLPDPEAEISTEALLGVVASIVTREDIRILCDNVYVTPPVFVPFSVEAQIEVFSGPDPTPVMEAAQAAVEELVASAYRLGASVTRSALIAALHQPGVREVTLTTPSTSVYAAPNEVPECVSISFAEPSVYEPPISMPGGSGSG